ncbi:hypothetical protein [Lysobacter hankyongensis]|uniref:PQ-loop repeat-containing protein n=1 Tax=Lysobacter hankyongensis TaxID=1176535 RepID=A0ABP9AIV6_9GAMM
MTDILKLTLGWAASAILLLTLIAQVRSQYRSGATQGVSRRLFVGQIASSVGFLSYSLLVGDRVFVFTNACILATAIAGEIVYLRNRRAGAKHGDTG